MVFQNLDSEKKSFRENVLDHNMGNGPSSEENRELEALTATRVKAYLEKHPTFLYEVIQSSGIANRHKQQQQPTIFTEDELSAGSETKRSMARSGKIRNEIYLQESKSNQPQLNKLIFNEINVLANVLQVDLFSLYTPNKNNTELWEYNENAQPRKFGSITKGKTVSGEAAFIHTTILVENIYQETRFSHGVGRTDRNVQSVLAIPLILVSGDFLGVIELCRKSDKNPFTESDLQLCNSYFAWMGISLHQAKITRLINLQSKLNEYLLDSSKQLFDDMISIDNLVENILMFTKDVVQADRCAMFLADEEREQLYAHYFDEGSTENGKPVFSKNQQIRFSANKGIAGHVYQTGEAVNIADAYGDKRFNPEVDKQTGYRTKNILCMPIISKSRVVGVLQMINSLSNDRFTPGDEDVFKTYAVYCALALHCSKLYDLIMQTKAQYEITMEVLRYHRVCNERDVRALELHVPVKCIPENFFTYDFNSYVYEKILPNLFIYMIHDMFGRNVFPLKKLCTFVLTVRKNYRPVSYHNWFHAMHVAQSIYCMLKKNRDKFNTHECMALLVAALCHDLDHRGYNNAYFKQFHLPLSALYSSSIMEEHHYQQMVTILEMEGHDVFSFLSKNDYKEMLAMMYDAIIATDLANYFGNQNTLVQMIKNKSFDLHKKECRTLCKALMMTGADLVAIAKPVEQQQEIVESIYTEFFIQGDEEKKHGLQPVCMMDRQKKNEIPKQEVDFIKFIAKPLYLTLDNVIAGIKPLLNGTIASLELWQKLADENEKKKGNVSAS